MTDLTVHYVTSEEAAGWLASLTEQGGFPALESWNRFLQRVYRFPVYRLAVGGGEDMQGLLCLMHIRHPVFGNYLTTAPFASWGGFAAAQPQAARVLLEEAQRLAARPGVEYVLVRHLNGGEAPPPGWVQMPHYATYRVDLPAAPQALMSRFSSDHRNHIRKSLRKGFTVRFGRLDLLDDCYAALAHSMHELGSPYHSKSYLRAMLETLGGQVECAVLYDERGGLAGAGVFILQGDTMHNLHANILRRYRPLYAGEFLYWSAVQRAIEKGLRVFDLGRSLIGSGNETFKLKWQPRKQPLAYWHCLRPGAALPELNQKNPRFRLAIWTWKRLPFPLVRLIGPWLIRGLA